MRQQSIAETVAVLQAVQARDANPDNLAETVAALMAVQAMGAQPQGDCEDVD